MRSWMRSWLRPSHSGRHPRRSHHPARVMLTLACLTRMIYPGMEGVKEGAGDGCGDGRVIYFPERAAVPGGSGAPERAADGAAPLIPGTSPLLPALLHSHLNCNKTPWKNRKIHKTCILLDLPIFPLKI